MKKRVEPLPPSMTQWYVMHPNEFDINKMEANEMQFDNGTCIAKMPRIKGRIRREGKNVLLVIGRETDEETGEVYEETIKIGEDAGGFFPGMMFGTFQYHDYFDAYGNLAYDPMKASKVGAEEQEDEEDTEEEEETDDAESIEADQEEDPEVDEEPDDTENGETEEEETEDEKSDDTESSVEEQEADTHGAESLVERRTGRRGQGNPAHPVGGPGSPVPTGPSEPSEAEQEEEMEDNETTAESEEQYDYMLDWIEKELKEKYEVTINGTAMVRIPEVEGIRKLPVNQHGVQAIEYVRDHWYDPEKKQNRNKKSIIGQASKDYPNLMIPGRRYYDLFDYKTGKPKENLTAAEEGEGEVWDDLVQEVLQKEDTIRQQAAEEERQQVEENVEKQERLSIITKIFQSMAQTISAQAKKHPDHIVNVYKTRRINEILIEIKMGYRDSGYEDLLELVEEPEEVEENGQKYLTGMTYSDVELLLTHYDNILIYQRPKRKK